MTLSPWPIHIDAVPTSLLSFVVPSSRRQAYVVVVVVTICVCVVHVVQEQGNERKKTSKGKLALVEQVSTCCWSFTCSEETNCHGGRRRVSDTTGQEVRTRRFQLSQMFVCGFQVDEQHMFSPSHFTLAADHQFQAKEWTTTTTTTTTTTSLKIRDLSVSRTLAMLTNKNAGCFQSSGLRWKAEVVGSRTRKSNIEPNGFYYSFMTVQLRFDC